MSLSDLFIDAFKRDYRLFSCGYIKNRRRIVVVEKTKSIGRPAAVFKHLKRKYKSAWFDTKLPIKELLYQNINAKNVLMKRLSGMSDLMKGKTIIEPIEYK